MFKIKRVQGHSRDAMIRMDHSHCQVGIREYSHLEPLKFIWAMYDNRTGFNPVKHANPSDRDPESGSCSLLRYSVQGHVAASRVER
jgi:hypothetical protein